MALWNKNKCHWHKTGYKWFLIINNSTSMHRNRIPAQEISQNKHKQLHLQRNLVPSGVWRLHVFSYCAYSKPRSRKERRSRQRQREKVKQSLRFPHSVEEVHEIVVDHEGDGHIQRYTAQPWHCTFVKSAHITMYHVCFVFFMYYVRFVFFMYYVCFVFFMYFVCFVFFMYYVCFVFFVYYVCFVLITLQIGWVLTLISNWLTLCFSQTYTCISFSSLFCPLTHKHTHLHRTCMLCALVKLALAMCSFSFFSCFHFSFCSHKHTHARALAHTHTEAGGEEGWGGGRGGGLSFSFSFSPFFHMLSCWSFNDNWHTCKKKKRTHTNSLLQIKFTCNLSLPSTKVITVCTLLCISVHKCLEWTVHVEGFLPEWYYLYYISL